MTDSVWGSVVSVASAAAESFRRHTGWQQPLAPNDHRPPPAQLSVAPAATHATTAPSTPPPTSAHPTIGPAHHHTPGLAPDSDSSSDDGEIHFFPRSPSAQHHSVSSNNSDLPLPSIQPSRHCSSTTPSRRRPVSCATPPPRHAKPITKIAWREWIGCDPPSTAPIADTSTATVDAATALLKDVHTTIICDGSKTQTRMGLGFISHHHRTRQTFLFAKPLDLGEDNNSMLAETLTLVEALLDAQASQSASIHVITDSRTLRQLVLGREHSRGPAKVGKRLADANQQLLGLLRSFDYVYVSHVASHKNLLTENSIADLFAGLASEHGFHISDTLSTHNRVAILSRINSLRLPRNSVKAAHIPFLHQHSTGCDACHCPSHSKQSCVLNKLDSFPSLSIYCKKQPTRPSTFADQLSDPSMIDWDTAPACISYVAFTRFFTTCVNNLRQQQFAEGSWYAICQFSATYRVINSHISRYKRPKDYDPHPPEDSENHYKKLAANAKTAARLARDLRFHDAMKVLDKQQPVGPLCPEALHQLPALFPPQVTDARIPPSWPGGRVSFDRHAVHRYVNSRSSTSSPGISGFGFNWIQLFARLTVAQETDENEDPNWTIFVSFLEDFACGALPWLRHWATDLKGALFNKNPESAAIKLRNLGIAEVFVRIAAYMVMTEALPHAHVANLISAFDFGVAVPGGCEKFVKLAQAAALAGCTIVSCDLEKAFNNVLRRDLWETVQHLNCPLLTSWFCFFYHVPPRVHFAADPSAPFTLNNVATYTLHEGVAQGDPLSSFLFVCTLAFILRSHRSMYPDFIRTSVIDDLCFYVAPSCSRCLLPALDDLDSILKRHNLLLNKSKTTLYNQDDLPFHTPPSFPYHISHHGFSVCRVHVGTTPFCETLATTRILQISKLELSFQRLHRALDFCQTPGRGLIFIDLLRLCFRSRFSWDMRIQTPSLACRIAKAADAATKRLLHLTLPRHPRPPLPPEWVHLERIHEIKLNLPLVKGGLGLRSWRSLLEVSHFASWVESGISLFHFFEDLKLHIPHSILASIGDSVTVLSQRFDMPPDFWLMHAKRLRSKVQHELTEKLDDAEIAEASTLSHDPSVNAQFCGSTVPSMSLPFNSALIPRYILNKLDTYDFAYALAWHAMLPLFHPTPCTCSKMWDPLGLHAASCLHLNAYNLLHNSVRDCFAGAARSRVAKDQCSNVAYIFTDKHAKSATWMHEFYPLKHDAPTIIHRDDPSRCPAPSLSPDILIAFTNDPLNPYFGDFVASSPSLVNKLKHTEAAQAAFTTKLQHYSKHHVYPSRVCYPLAFERSGYLHPAFEDFIDLYSRCSSSQPQPQTALQLRFAVSFAITFTTATLLRAASLRLLPRSIIPFLPPKPIPVPTCWAPSLSSFSLVSTRISSAHTMSRASARPVPLLHNALVGNSSSIESTLDGETLGVRI
jgi:ribonuclease HI